MAIKFGLLFLTISIFTLFSIKESKATNPTQSDLTDMENKFINQGGSSIYKRGFVRIGRGGFVRIGRQFKTVLTPVLDEELNRDPEDDIDTKYLGEKRGSFVRIGKKSDTLDSLEEKRNPRFVRVGRVLHAFQPDLNEKRASFVRIG